MKEKLSKILDILFESFAYLVINYTLSSMYTSFKIHWYAVPFLATNLYVRVMICRLLQKVRTISIGMI